MEVQNAFQNQAPLSGVKCGTHGRGPRKPRPNPTAHIAINTSILLAADVYLPSTAGPGVVSLIDEGEVRQELVEEHSVSRGHVEANSGAQG